MQETTETIKGEKQDEELADVLTAISVVAKRLARNLRNMEKEGGLENGQDERTGTDHRRTEERRCRY